MIALQRESGS